MSFAFVSLITSDDYLPGLICLSKSLKSKYPLVVLAVPEKLSTSTVNALYNAYDSVIFVSEIKSNQFKELDLLGRRDLNSTLTKIHCFNPQIMKYDRICFLDADVLVLENIDGIFDYLNDPDVMFAAAPDVGWPDCFNSGVFVTRPLPSLFLGLLDLNKNVGSFDGGDQGLLNSFFSSWSGHSKTNAPKSVRLPFTFNVTPTAFYSYLPAFAAFNDKISCIHFIGKEKPWNYERFSDGGIIPRGSVENKTLEMIQKWWTAFDGEVRQKITLVKKSSFGHSKKDSSSNNSHHKVTWADPETTQLDARKSEKSQKSVNLKMDENPSQETLGFSNYRIDWNPKEVRRSSSPEKKLRGNVQQIETPYHKFEKSVSSYAKKVEENPPESFSEYRISWDDSR